MANRFDITVTFSGDEITLRQLQYLFEHIGQCNEQYGDADWDWACSIFDPVPCKHRLFCEGAHFENGELYVYLRGLNTDGEPFVQEIVNLLGLDAIGEAYDEDHMEVEYTVIPERDCGRLNYKLRDLGKEAKEHQETVVKLFNLSSEEQRNKPYDVCAEALIFQKELQLLASKVSQVRQRYSKIMSYNGPEKFRALASIRLTSDESDLMNFILRV